MNCRYYRSKEEYYGVSGTVPTMTSGFWECEPEEEEIKEYFLDWLEENGEFLEPNFPKGIKLFCEECDDYYEFDDIVPGDVWSKKELLEINKKALKEWLAKGEIDEEDYKYGLEELEEIFNTKEKQDA